MDTMVRVPKPTVPTVLTLTAVAVDDGTATYTYSACSGPSPVVGMSLVVTGFSIAGNNVTAVVTAVATNEVVVATTTQEDETHAGVGTGVITKITIAGGGAAVTRTVAPSDLLLFSSDQPFYIAFGADIANEIWTFYFPAGLLSNAFEVPLTVTEFAIGNGSADTTLNVYYMQIGKR